jgi:hypothetical protein
MTDGHVDGVCAFARPGVLLVDATHDKGSVYAEVVRENRRALELATDAQGRKFELLDLYEATAAVDTDAEVFCASYTNFYIANGAIIMPAYGIDADQAAAEQLAMPSPAAKWCRCASTISPTAAAASMHHPAAAGLACKGTMSTCASPPPDACSWDLPGNLDRAEQLVRQAAAEGAQVILLQELFATPYFCIEQCHSHQALAEDYHDSPLLQRFAALAKELGVVLPLSWYERAGNAFFNSLTVADADGTLLGCTARPTSPTPSATRRRNTSAPATPASKSGTPPSAAWASASAGTSGSRDRPLPGADGRRSAAVPHRHRLRARRAGWTRATIGRSPCAAMPPPTCCRWWPPTGSARKWPAAISSCRCASTARRSSATTKAPCSPKPTAPAVACGCTTWTWRRCARTA